MNKPIIALTIGDPAGIGPEICLRAAVHKEVKESVRLILVGDRTVLDHARGFAKVHAPIKSFGQEHLAGILLRDQEDFEIELLDCKTLDGPVELGIPSEAGGKACYTYICSAIDNAKEGFFHGVATAPINKLSLSLAGCEHIGHTEIFGERTSTDKYSMMLYSDKIAVGLVTIHQSLRSVPDALTLDKIVEVGRLLNDAVSKIRGRKTRMAVLGLNPHAGESGLLGKEELTVVNPAVEKLQELGIDATGPLPPDTAFTKSALEKYDAHLCLYHDQGLIPFKMLAFDVGVNVTMGLPFPRTSVDHGTAYDIAGHGVAGVTSLIEAIKLAGKLAAKNSKTSPQSP